MLTVYPQLALIQKFHIGRVSNLAVGRAHLAQIFGINSFLYAVMTFAIAGTKNAGGLLACRFVLGLAEGFGAPSSGLLISAWWKRSEHGWRTVMVYNTFSSIVNGLLS